MRNIIILLLISVSTGVFAQTKTDFHPYLTKPSANFISLSELQQTGEVKITDNSIKVQSFFIMLKGSSDKPFVAECKGSQFNTIIKEVLLKAVLGDIILIGNIKVKTSCDEKILQENITLVVTE